MVITDDHLETLVAVELLSRACKGDSQAFCRLIEPLQTRLLRQAVALSGDINAAEDLVSETLVEAWKSLSRYDRTCRLSTWLYAILLHRYQKFIRRARSRPISLASLPRTENDELTSRQEGISSEEPSPAETALQKEQFLRIRQSIERLSEKHRDVILLRFFEDASLEDMARVLDCSIGTVKSRLHHALEKLRKMKLNLSEPGGDTPV